MTEPRFGLLSDAPASFVLLGARVIDPSQRRDLVGDLAVRDGVIVADAGDDMERIDARGLVVAPGFCDLHAHLREPGTDGAESIASGTRAAARGGFTTVCAMPNTEPPSDSPAVVRRIVAAPASARVRVVAAATVGRNGHARADIGALAGAGAVAFSDDGSAVPTGLVGELLEAVAGVGRPLIEHAEDGSLAAGGVVRAGPVAVRLGLCGWRPEAEAAVARRDMRLAAATGARVTGAGAGIKAGGSTSTVYSRSTWPEPQVASTRKSR